MTTLIALSALLLFAISNSDEEAQAEVHVSGRVVDAADPAHGLAGVDVSAREKDREVWSEDTVTNASGEYRFALTEGAYLLKYQKTGYIAYPTRQSIHAEVNPTSVADVRLVRRDADSGYYERFAEQILEESKGDADTAETRWEELLGMGLPPVGQMLVARALAGKSEDIRNRRHPRLVLYAATDEENVRSVQRMVDEAFRTGADFPEIGNSGRAFYDFALTAAIAIINDGNIPIERRQRFLMSVLQNVDGDIPRAHRLAIDPVQHEMR